MSETSEVITARMDLLHKRRFGVHHAATPEHAMHLADTRLRLQDVFEYCLSYNAVKAPVEKGQVVSVARDSRSWPQSRIDLNEGDLRRNGFETDARNRAANNQNIRVRIFGEEVLKKRFEIDFCFYVDADRG